MQTPAGHEIRDGVAYPLDWIAIIFNPSFPYRFAHMLNAAYLTTAVVVLAVGARYLLADRHVEEARTMLRMAVGMILVSAPLQLFIGDQHGLNTLEHQPVKVAAMEGALAGERPRRSRPLRLAGRGGGDEPFRDRLAWAGGADPDPRVGGDLSRPRRLSERGSAAGRQRLLRLPHHGRHRRALHRGRYRWGACSGGAEGSSTARWFLRLASYAWPLGFIAILAGWIVTEQGRQPWVVYGLMRTADGVSPVPARASPERSCCSSSSTESCSRRASTTSTG